MGREEQYITDGAEKEVFQDDTHPDEVLKRYHEVIEKDRRFAIQRFYLTKILHLLFPNSIPDITFSGIAPNEIRRLKINVHSGTQAHHKLKQLHRQKEVGSPLNFAEESLEEAYFDLWDRIRADSSYTKFIREMKLLGVAIDPHVVNFTYDPSGNLVYFEEFHKYDSKKLKTAIEENLSGAEKEKALAWFIRLEKAYKS